MALTLDMVRDHLLQLPGAEETYPFDATTAVFKVGGKMFALVGVEQDPLRVSCKVDPALGEQLRAQHASIEPGYHLNKRHWITITSGGDVPDRQLFEHVEDSYDLVTPPGTAKPG